MDHRDGARRRRRPSGDRRRPTRPRQTGRTGQLKQRKTPPTLVVQLACPDQRGIVAHVARLVYEAGGNIVHNESHREESQPAAFFMRLVIDASALTIPHAQLTAELETLASGLKGRAEVWDADHRARVAVMVTKEGTCLQALLEEHRAARLPCEIPLVVGSENALAGVVRPYGIPFVHAPCGPGAQDGEAHEREVLRLLDEAEADVVVLARYMKVLSPQFVERYVNRIINVHHGLLPAFKGSRPYHQAWDHGVKVIGATAHYVTAELDAGPIISQDIVAVTHKHSPEEMVDAGRDVERRVLSEAVKAHLDG